MAATDFGALSDARKKVWAKKAWQAGRDDSFFFSHGFMSKSENDFNNVIQRVTSLTKTEGGLECIMQLVADLEGDGVAGDNELTGNEEQMFNDTQKIQIDQLRHAVRSKGKVSEQATVLRFRELGRGKLGFWIGDKVDELCFLTASGRAFTLNTDGTTRTNSQLSQLNFANDVAAASTNRILFQGTATAEDELTTSDTVTWDFLVTAHAKAKRAKMRPIRSKGKGYYVVVLSTEQCRDLKKSSDWKTLTSRAKPRSDNHPLFTTSEIMVDGLVIHEHNKVFNTLGLTSTNKWGSSGTVDGAQALMMGAQAIGFAQIGDMDWLEADTDDYGNRQGLGVARMFGTKKPQWKTSASQSTAEDFGVFSLKTAAAA